MGRFLSEDPLGFADGGNPYKFAGNDPINFADPTGTTQAGYPLSGGYSGGRVVSQPIYNSVATAFAGGLGGLGGFASSVNTAGYSAPKSYSTPSYNVPILTSQDFSGPRSSASGVGGRSLVDLTPLRVDVPNWPQSNSALFPAPAVNLKNVGVQEANRAVPGWSAITPAESQQNRAQWAQQLDVAQFGGKVLNSYEKNVWGEWKAQQPLNGAEKWQAAESLLMAASSLRPGAGPLSFGTAGPVALGSQSKSNGSEPQPNGRIIERGSNPSRLTFGEIEVRAVRPLDHLPQSTLEAMSQRGFAATDINGNSLILHHMKQNPSGPVVEMPAIRHNINNAIQHPLGNTPGVGLTPQQRSDFNGWRTEYWKARATEELNRRGTAP